VEPIDEYQLRALRLGRKRFAEAHEGLYLVKRPMLDPPTTPGEDPRDALHYETVSVGGDDELGEAAANEASSFEWQWRVAAVKKKEGNPFPDRVSVGRARNCDIVLRLPYISKLHAHFMISGKVLAVCDQRSANGTAVNGHEVEPGKNVPVGPGDLVSFGSLELEVADGTLLYDILMSEARKR
jgi:hypothetical protein